MPALFQDPTVPEYYTRIGGVRTQALFTATDFDLSGFTAGSILFADGTTIAEDNANLVYDDVNNYFGLGVNPPDATLNIERTFTDLSGSESLIDATVLINPASASTWAGTGINMVVAKVGTQDSTASHSAFKATIAHSGTGTVLEFKGVALQCFNVLGGTLDFGIGGEFKVSNLGVGTIGSAVAQQNSLNNSNAAGTMDEAVGFRLLALVNAGTITNTKGIEIRSLTAGTQPADSVFAIHSSDSNAKMYFAGKIGIGVETPLSLLEVRAVAGSPGLLTLSTAELTVVDGDVLGQIDFLAPLESGGSDAILLAASIWAEADAEFTTTVNATELVFATAESEAAVEKMRLTSDGRVGIRISTPAGQLDVEQLGTAAAIPVMVLNQADVDEDYFKFIGTSDTNVDRALVDAADFSTPGAIVGWLKVNVQDDQGTTPIVDGDYYIPFYAAPTA